MRHEWGGLCKAVGAIQLRDVKRFFEQKLKINAKLKLPLKRHTFWRRCQISQQNTMLATFRAFVIHPLVTMLVNINLTSAFSEGNSEASPHKRRIKCDTNISPKRLMTHLLHQMVHHRTTLRGNGQRSATIMRITTHTHTTILIIKRGHQSLAPCGISCG